MLRFDTSNGGKAKWRFSYNVAALERKPGRANQTEMNKVIQLLLGNPESKALERRQVFVFISSALLAFPLLVPVLLPQDIAHAFRWIGVLAVASVVYAWRYMYYSLNRRMSSKRKWLNLAMLYVALLPFVYLSTGLTP